MRLSTTLRKFFLLPTRMEPRTEEQAREYEWRRASGEAYKRAVAFDACDFWLRSYALGWVVAAKPPVAVAPDAPKSDVPNTSLTLHVAATGEKVPIEGVVGVRARLSGGETDWRAFTKSP